MTQYVRIHAAIKIGKTRRDFQRNSILIARLPAQIPFGTIPGCSHITFPAK